MILVEGKLIVALNGYLERLQLEGRRFPDVFWRKILGSVVFK
jgi:hypothetical protein